MTLRIGSLVQGPAAADHEATWLLGHTARIRFRNLRREGNDLLVDAVLRVRCRYLKSAPDGAARCAAHGFTGPVPASGAGEPQPRKLGGRRFLIVENHQLAALDLPLPPRSLPVVENDPDDVNPCSIAPCTTADHTRGSACCRDLQVEILCARGNTALEALVRSRLSPYLCKVTREAEDALEAEVISACGFLDQEGLNCTLHGRQRPDGRPAKPELCSDWPDDGKGLHPGCIFYQPPARKRSRRQ